MQYQGKKNYIQFDGLEKIIWKIVVFIIQVHIQYTVKTVSTMDYILVIIADPLRVLGAVTRITNFFKSTYIRD